MQKKRGEGGGGGGGGGGLFKELGCQRVKEVGDQKWWYIIAGVGNISQG